MAYPWAVLAVAAALSATTAAHAQKMFKCVDERGVTHYTDKPPPGCKGGKVDIHGQPPISGKLSPQHEDLTGAEREFRTRQMDRERKEKDEAKKREAQKQRCARLQSQYRVLASGRRVARINEKGERIYMEDAERERRAAQLKGELARNCPS